MQLIQNYISENGEFSQIKADSILLNSISSDSLRLGYRLARNILYQFFDNHYPTVLEYIPTEEEENGSAPKESNILEAAPELIQSQSLMIYPNPTNQLLTITWNAEELNTHFEVRIINMRGVAVYKQILQGKTGKQHLDIAHLSAGIYLFQTINQGKPIHVEKLVVND